jgi:hypothetical protein
MIYYLLNIIIAPFCFEKSLSKHQMTVLIWIPNGGLCHLGPFKKYDIYGYDVFSPRFIVETLVAIWWDIA